MQITLYSHFRAVHDEDWAFPDPWIFLRRTGWMNLPHPTVQSAKAKVDSDAQSVLPLNWLFVPCE